METAGEAGATSENQNQSHSESPETILARSFRRASDNLATPLITEMTVQNQIQFVSANLQNRAGVRLLLACTLAKVHRPNIDIRKPYTEIGGPDAYSGRTYDERYVSPFILEHSLPCNPTTAFLTPALRNRNVTLTPDLNLVGRPPRIYHETLQLLTDVHVGLVSAEDVLSETIRLLVVLRDQQRLRVETLLSQLQVSDESTPLSAEGIVTLIQQHLASPRTSRLPVLIVAAAYQVAAANLAERALPLHRHNAADKQTGALGDVEIMLVADAEIITSYEMKDKRVTQNDIDNALTKILAFQQTHGRQIDNYVFITTETIDKEVQEYASHLYEMTGGVEFVLLDCIGFLRYFLHLFHRLRMLFLEAYQELVLAEPDSAVSQPLKEAFLALRRAAENELADGLSPTNDE